MSTVSQAFIGMGANLGDRVGTLYGALARLRARADILYAEMSSLFETDPVGFADQPMFLNCVTGLETTLGPEQLLDVLMKVEHEFGRVREVRWGPRTLDLDLLAFENESRATPALELPHPRMLERGFVVIPFQELLARGRFQKPIWNSLRAEIDQAVSFSGVRRYLP